VKSRALTKAVSQTGQRHEIMGHHDQRRRKQDLVMRNGVTGNCRKKETEKLKFKMNPANGGHGTGEVAEEGYYDWFWACCNCGGSGSMGVDMTLACPECGVYRCGDCPLESVKRSRVHHSASLEGLQPTTEPHQTTLQEAHQGTSSIVQKAHSWLSLKQGK
jgi:hypothetical protein